MDYLEQSLDNFITIDGTTIVLTKPIETALNCDASNWYERLTEKEMGY